MEIILTQDVPTLGMAGQVIKVSPGYARNYLLPGSYALPATPGNLRRLAKKRDEFEARSRAERENALILKQTLESLTLTIARKSVDKGKLYGAVTPQDIVDAAALENVALDRRRLKISEPIKSVGDYDIAVRLHPEVTGSFRLKVVAEKEPEPPAPEGEGKARRKPGERAEAEAVPEESPGEAAPVGPETGGAAPEGEGGSPNDAEAPAE
ncbi:MAG: 50S ribosomal protein L9 [Deltaproteobacteria bacterium]|jgi:large subunit ribosomal protein L9|nr:50S ribosomal protein L9 [Deltaproteobacteria bacterium]